MTLNDFTYGYEVDLSIREKYSEGLSRNDSDIDTEIIHASDGGKGLLKWMLSGDRADEYRQNIGLFHRFIEPNGRIIEIINPHRWVYHTGTSRWDCRTIATEIVKLSSAYPTEAQYVSLAEITLFDSRRFKLKVIEGHNQYQLEKAKVYTRPGRSVCPGKFDWDTFATLLRMKGFDFTQTKEKYVLRTT